jgi:uncharacterized delta-60 repeat protein
MPVRLVALAVASALATAATGCGRVLGIQEKVPSDAAVNTPGFHLNVATTAVSVVRRHAATVPLTVDRFGGFDGPVSVISGALPGGVSLDPLSLDPTQTSGVLTFHAASSATFGAASIEVIGVSPGSPVQTQSLELIVQDPSGSPDLMFGAAAGTPGRVQVAMGIGAQGVGTGGLKVAPGVGSCGSEGPIVLCGHARTDHADSAIALARLCPDGTPDPGFGDSGVAFANSAASSSDACNAMFLRAGAGINLAGFATRAADGTRDMMAGRFVPIGIPDQNTGAGGFVTTRIDSAGSIANGLLAADAVLPGPAGVGSFIAGGHGAGGAVFVAYQRTGALYTGFGDNGVATVGPPDTSAMWLASQSSGSVVAAVAAAQFRILRFTPVGKLDTAFADGGIADVGDVGSSAAVVLVTPTNAVLAVGTAPGAGGSQDVAVVRLTESGQVDKQYGAAGWASAHFGADGSKSFVSAAALTGDGAVVIAGQTPTDSGAPAFSVIRINSAGALDTAFGVGGLQTFDANGMAQAIAIDGLGRILVAGVAGGADASDGVVVYRLWP